MGRSFPRASARKSVRRSVLLSLATVALAQGWAAGAAKTFDIVPLAGSSLTSPAQWFLGANWSPVGVPTSTDDVSIGGLTALPVNPLLSVLQLGPVAPGTFSDAGDLTIDAPVNVSTPSAQGLYVRAVASGPGGFDTPVSVSGTLSLATFSGSVVTFDARNLRLTDPAAVHRLGQSGGGSDLRIFGSPAAPVFGHHLSVAGPVVLGDGMNAALFDPSAGSVSLRDGATADFGGNLRIARSGAVGQLSLESGSSARVAGDVVVGAGGTLLPTYEYYPSSGDIQVLSGFSDPVPSVLTLEAGRLDLGTNTSDEPDGIAHGDAMIMRSRLEVGSATSGPAAAIIVGRNARLDLLLGFRRSESDLRFVGRAYFNPPGGPLVEVPSLDAHATAFVGVEGGQGNLSSDASHLIFHRDVVVGTGSVTLTTGGSEPETFTVPADGTFDVGLNSRIDIRQDVFIGNNNAFGTFNATASGDGGSFTTARFVGVGNGGTGRLNVAGMNTVRVRTVEVFNDSGPEVYQAGGFVELGPDGVLSSVDYDFNQEGSRLNWVGGTLELRGGLLSDFGVNTLTIPTTGVLRGAGTVQTDVLNDGHIELGYIDNNNDFTFPNTLTIAGDYASNPDSLIQLAIRNPTRLAGGSFDTVVFSSDAQFSGTLSVFFNGDNNNLPYLWSPFDASTIQPGDTFDLFDFTGTVTGAFDAFNLPFLDFPYEWRTDRLYTQGEIYVAIIPEPAALSLLTPAALLLTRRRR